MNFCIDAEASMRPRLFAAEEATRVASGTRRLASFNEAAAFRRGRGLSHDGHQQVNLALQ